MSKVDKELGKRVHEHLVSIGKETPMSSNSMTTQEKLDAIELQFEKIMSVLGLDLSDDSLVETPKRVAKMFVNEIFTGLDYENFPKATTVENKMNYNQMVLEKNVTISSSCEHHFLVIDGFAHIAYIPNKKVLGLSKLNRIADFFARRPQIQERLTEQIGEALKFILETDDVAVVIEATHMCVKARGIKDQHSMTSTTFLSGVFSKDQSTRHEFISSIRS